MAFLGGRTHVLKYIGGEGDENFEFVYGVMAM